MFVRRMILFPRLIAFIAISIGIYCLSMSLQGNGRPSREAFFVNFDAPNSNIDHACSMPKLNPFASDIMKHVKNLERLQCKKEEDWVYTQGGKVRLQQEIVSSYSDVQCTLKYILRKDDDHQYLIDGGILNNLDPELRLKHDFFKIQCSIQLSHLSWSKIFASIHLDVKLLTKYNRTKSFINPKIEKSIIYNLNESKEADKLAYTHDFSNVNKPLSQPLNVLFYGLDSLSRVHVIRKLPKTYEALTKKYKANVLQMYNIVGDGSPQALIPILTGKTELELPLTLKNKPNSQTVDVYPFIWKNFSDYGYVTQYGEDTPHIGTFTYRMRGFKNQPTDFYLRPFYLQGWSGFFSNKNYCYAGKPRHSIMTQWAKEFFETYEKVPKYSFNFHAEISHDDFNLVQIMDDDLVEWLEELETLNVFNTSIVIFMSDHGARFSEMRSTLQGKFEERLPFFSIMVPPWFAKRFPNAYSHLQTNSESRFVTPFDIHASLMSVLTHFNRGLDTAEKKKFKEVLPRSLSVFEEIPTYRSCEHSDVENHWCSCLQWIPLDVKEPRVQTAATFFVQYLNEITSKFRYLCAPLSLKLITRAQQVRPKNALLHFKKSADTRGFVPDLTDNTQISKEVYQLQVVVQPSDGMFEATVSYMVQEDRYVIKESEVSRINMYGDQDRCIHEQQPQLRKYCYCKS